MYSLFIDTHLNNVVIVLYKAGEVLKLENVDSPSGHSKVVMPLIKSVMEEFNLKPEELSEIIVVNGPGSFTGVRIGVTIAKTLAYTLNISIKVINSLLVKAINISGNKKVAIKDRNGAYIGNFNANNNLIGEYEYISKELINETEFNEVEEMDYKKIYEYVKTLSAIHPHAVKPLYIKKVEVEK